MEDSRTEFKLDLTKKDTDFKAEIVAFLNTKGGQILLGVDDSGTTHKEIIKEKSNYWNETLTNWINDAFSSDARSLIKIFANETSFKILIEEGQHKPYYFKNGDGFNGKGVYIRVGSSKRLASDEEIKQMFISHNQIPFERINIPQNNLTFNYLENYFKSKQIPFDLMKLSLKDINGNYNNAALLFSDQNQKISKFAVYQGVTVEIFLDKKEFKGSILKQLIEIIYFAKLLNRKKVLISGEPSRQEIYDIPKVALRESIVNSFCHRNWSFDGEIKIEFFDDKVSILSPGGLSNNATLESLKNGFVSRRNQIIVDILNKIGIIENYGTGVGRIFESYSDFHKEPEYIIQSNFVKLNLFNRNFTQISFDVKRKNSDTQKNVDDTQKVKNDTETKENDTQKVIYDTKKVKNDTQKSIDDTQTTNKQLDIYSRFSKIIDLMSKNPNITISELQKQIASASIATIKRDIRSLTKNKNIKYVGSAKTGKWLILNPNFYNSK